VSSYVNERVKAKQLPFDALVDSADVFYDDQLYFGRMGGGVFRADHRAEAFAKLAGLVFLLDASDMSTAFKFQWKKSGYLSAADDPQSLQATLTGGKLAQRIMMSENADWLAQMSDQRVDVLVNKPILIVLTKCDAANAETAEQVRDRLLSKHVTGRNIRIQECAGSDTYMKGLEEGFNWLSVQVNNVNKSRQWFVNKKNYPINAHVVLGKLCECGNANENSSNTPPAVVKSAKPNPLTFNSVLTAAAKAVL